MTRQKGFILFITFSMLALCTALVSVFMVKGITHKKLAFGLLEQERLHQFAVSSLALGQSFLSVSAEDTEKESDQQLQDAPVEKIEKKSPVDLTKLLLEKLVPVLGKPQEIKFIDIKKDFPIVIHLTFFSEAGKININSFYNLVQNKFYDEGIEGKDRKVFAVWLFDKIAKITGKPSLFGPFTEFMKQRKAPLNDVTELLGIKEFAACFTQAIFYDPMSKSSAQAHKHKKIFLTDLFTVSCENDTIQPWLLSPSVCTLLDIAQKNDKNDILEKKEDKMDISSFKQKSDWNTDWDIALKPLYGISYERIPKEIREMLATQFSASVFSVLASVTNENMTVRVFAILKQKRLPDGAIFYDIIKIYQV